MPRNLLRTSLVALALMFAASPLLAQDTKPPAQQPAEPIDFNKAREILQKVNRGEKVSAEDAAYLERAKAERQRMQQQRPQPGQPNPNQRPNQPAPPPRESIGLTPLNQLPADQKYKGFEGGLYGGGKNEPTGDHARLLSALSKSIAPLSADGKPDPAGKIAMLSIGMSNTTQEFSRFKELADRDDAKRPALVIVDGAQGGRAADDWANDVPQVWQEADRRIAAAGASPQQVQVVWIKQAEKGPSRLGEFPAHAKTLQSDLEKILILAKKRYPNLKLAYLSSRIYAGYAASNLNPEPYAYESAFSVRWVIEKQSTGDASLNADAAKGEVKSPGVLWGPYLWADGTKPRPDGLTYTREDLAGDGTHPSNAGRQKVAEQLLTFFKTDPASRSWFAR